jgi:transcriptional regulator with XRE-family HTH domain
MTATKPTPDLMVALRMALSEHDKAQREAFAIRVKRARNRQRLSQPDLAKAAGVQLRAVQHWEAAETLPRHDNFRRLAQALDVSPQELYPETPEPVETLQNFLGRIEEKLDLLLMRSGLHPDDNGEGPLTDPEEGGQP